jgi:hypothetical protein
MNCYIKKNVDKLRGNVKVSTPRKWLLEKALSYGCWQFPQLQYQTMNTLKLACEVPQGFSDLHQKLLNCPTADLTENDCLTAGSAH